MSIFGALKSHMETLYEGRCTIKEFSKESGIINNTVVNVVGENIPCRLSYGSSSASRNKFATPINQGIKLFLNPDISVKAGSEIEVTQYGITKVFDCSSQPIVYESHQEIELTLKDRYA